MKSEWVNIHEKEPELRDACILMHFVNGSIETVHIEDFFRPITSGLDENGKQKFTKWWVCHEPACTHWMELPDPPKKISETGIRNDRCCK